MAIPLITNLPPAPSRLETEETFVPKADALLGQLPTFVEETNTSITEINNTAEQVTSSKNSAVAAANYKGDWTELSDVKQGESYSYSGKEWIAKQDSVNVTPVEGAFWIEGFGDAVNVRYDNTNSALNSDNVQGAIDHLDGRLDSAETNISTIQNAMSKKFKSTPQIISSSAIISVNHGLTDEGGSPVKPFDVSFELICKTAEAGYSVGDTLQLSLNSSSGATSRVSSMQYNDTSVTFLVADNTNAFVAPNKSNSNVGAALINSNWDLIIKAWY